MISFFRTVFAPPRHLILLLAAVWIGLALAEKRAERRDGVDDQSAPSSEMAAIGEKAKHVLAEILNLMGFRADVELKTGERPDEIVLDIRSDNSGLLIGRKGQTLEALQYLVTRLALERGGVEGPHILVDVENYRDRRRKSLQDMALRLGEKAKRQRKTVTVDALSAADRRVIHAALQDDPWVSTKSLGQGAYRRLLIIPEGDRRRKEGDNSLPPGKSSSKSHPGARNVAAPAESEDDD